MTPERWLFAALLAVPLIVAGFGLGLVPALIVVAIWLLLRWLLTLTRLMKPGAPGLHLDTIAASHFAEKVRWCLDRADIPYTEHQSVGSLGAFFLGRTVPRLRAGTGVVTTSVGNSPEILRYLWGRYAHEDPERRAFLEPTPERVDMEHTLDQYGRNLQVWVYFHLLRHPETLSRAWGLHDPNVPVAQRIAAKLVAPLLRRMIRLSFNINPQSVEKARHYIDTLLASIEERLAEADCLIGSERSYIDYTFAGLSGLWLQPEQFGNGRALGVRLAPEQYPGGIRDDVNRWRERYPKTVSFLENLYQNERSSAAAPGA